MRVRKTGRKSWEVLGQLAGAARLVVARDCGFSGSQGGGASEEERSGENWPNKVVGFAVGIFRVKLCPFFGV